MSHFIQNYCAYHSNQILTNFCSCSQCLLPVCPSCIKIHSQQHLQKNTSPSFQKLVDVFQGVSNSCSNIISSLDKMREQLLEVEKVKKQNETLIRQKIKIYRTKLIREFQRALFDLEYTIIKTFEDEDEKFIQQLQDVDRNIDKLYKNIQCQQTDLYSDDGLRTVIFHLSKNIQVQSLQFVSSINQKIKEMLKKNIYLQIQQNRIEEIKNSVLSFLNLGVIDWKETKQKSRKINSNPIQIQTSYEIKDAYTSPKNNYNPSSNYRNISQDVKINKWP